VIVLDQAHPMVASAVDDNRKRDENK